MAHDIIKNCDEFIVQRIINPGVYWVFQSHSKAKREKEMELFNNFLSKNVEKITDPKGICEKMTVAVKIEEEFRRGVIIDKFYRNGIIKFLILLTDYAGVIESTEADLYWIKNEDLIDRQSSAVEVSIHGIKPVAYHLDYDNHFIDGLFKKRVHKRWSVSAYKYVQNIFEKNPCIYVRILNMKNKKISGEIFFVNEFGESPVSLGQNLCEKGFAVVSKAQTLPARKQVNTSIDRNIQTAHSMVREPTGVLRKVTSLMKEENLNNNNTLNSKANTAINFSSQESKAYITRNYSSDNTSDVPESIKKFDSSSSSSSGMFQIVQRSLALYEKQKLESQGSCNNSDRC